MEPYGDPYQHPNPEVGTLYGFWYTFTDGQEGLANHKTPALPILPGDEVEVTISGKTQSGNYRLKVKRPQQGNFAGAPRGSGSGGGKNSSYNPDGARVGRAIGRAMEFIIASGMEYRTVGGGFDLHKLEKDLSSVSRMVERVARQLEAGESNPTLPGEPVQGSLEKEAREHGIRILRRGVLTMRYVIDIETRPDFDRWDHLNRKAEFPREDKSPPSNYKSADAFANWWAREEAKWKESQDAKREKAAIDPFTGKVLIVGIMDIDEMEPIYFEGPEEKVLEDFWAFVRESHSDHFYFWPGSSDSDAHFDPAYLVQRSRVLGIPYNNPVQENGYLNSQWHNLTRTFALGKRGTYLKLDSAYEMLGLGKPETWR